MTVASVGIDLLVASVGGVAIGALAFFVIGLLRKHLTEVPADTALSFVAPYLAYVPAERLGASGVLAVVTAGLLLAHKAPVLQTAPSRLSERINWSSITFVLENSVFLLIGLQIAGLLDDVVNDTELSTGRTLLVGLVVLLTCLVLRPLWMIPYTLLTNRRADATVDRADRLRGGVVGSWAGMRGVVTLAAALTLPEETPLRAELVVIALVVTVGTLLLQGSTLPWLAASARRARPRPARGRPAGGHRARRHDRRGAAVDRGRPVGRRGDRGRHPRAGDAPGSTAAGSGSAPSAPATTRRRARPGPGCAPR